MRPRIKLSYRPKQTLIDAMRADGKAVEKLNHCLSAAALLRSVARSFEDDADEALKEYGLHIGEIKKAGRASDRAFDDYNHVITQLYVAEESGSLLCEDWGKLYEIVEKEPITEKIRQFIQ